MSPFFYLTKISKAPKGALLVAWKTRVDAGRQGGRVLLCTIIFTSLHKIPVSKTLHWSVPFKSCTGNTGSAV